ncbi:MAG: amidohydrolase, partial [Gammaproteobacteria bacterium]
MNKFITILTFTMFSFSLSSDVINNSIEKNSKIFENVALDIWEFAELGYLENKSSALLADTLKENGFKITKGLAGIPTSFIAEYNNGGPVIGILGEFDALPGLAQTSSPYKELAINDTNAGHACGHHLFGAASAWAAVAVKDWIIKNNV